MKKIAIFAVTSVLLWNNAFSKGEEEGVEKLEAKFVAAQNFELIHRNQSVPSDVRDWLISITPNQQLADYGEPYNATDFIVRGLPRAQHQYTVLNDKVSASLIKIGGFIQRQFLVLVDRERSDLACTYRVKWETQFTSTLQYAIEHKREMDRMDFFEEHPLCKKLKKP